MNEGAKCRFKCNNGEPFYFFSPFRRGLIKIEAKSFSGNEGTTFTQDLFVTIVQQLVVSILCFYWEYVLCNDNGEIFIFPLLKSEDWIIDYTTLSIFMVQH